jgi:hypothetical protein
MQNYNIEKKANNILKEKLKKVEDDLESQILRNNSREVEIKKLKIRLDAQEAQEQDLIELIMENMKLKLELENKSKVCLEDLKSVDISQVMVYYYY